jgi:hypothetical protein
MGSDAKLVLSEVRDVGACEKEYQSNWGGSGDKCTCSFVLFS